MKNLFLNIEAIADKINDDIIVMFSTGKDATVMLDLLMRKFPKDRLHVVYLYFIRGLSFKEKILDYYSNQYGITIDQYPTHELTTILRKRTGKSIYSGNILKQSDMQEVLREKYGTSWIAYGYRTQESIERAQMIKGEAINGIDWRNKKLYPVADWSAANILSWLKKRKLPLTIEYSFGLRDINMPYGAVLEWLKINFPDDYLIALDQFPFLAEDLLKWQMSR